MKVLVGVKRVVDYAVKVRVAADKMGVDLANVKMGLNPFCEIAVEEAVKLKEKGAAKEVVAVSIGGKACQEQLRTALAMGADRAIHIVAEVRTDQELQPLAVAKILKAMAEKEKADLVILGKQAIDGDNCQTSAMTASLLGWPQCTFAASVTVDSGKMEASIDRETDTGSEKLKVPLPAVISADLRLNEPRYPTLPNIMKARKKPLDTVAVETLNIDIKPRNVVVKVEDPPSRKAGIVVDSVDTLINKLKNEAAVI
jgi:electron transfer flavoprotein beta subunit